MSNVVELKIQVTAEEVKTAVDASFKKNVAKVNTPGFRKGKMPRQMFIKMYGIESLYPDAIDAVVNATYGKALDASDIDPIDYPEINFDEIFASFGNAEGFEYTAKVTVRPVPVLGEYKKLEVEKFNKSVLVKDVNAELDVMRNRKAEIVLKEKGKAASGDTVVIDFEGFVDGVAFEGGKGMNHSLELGSNSFIPGFEDQLIGAKTGEEVDVVVTFPEEYHAENLAGKEATFKCTVHEIKSKKLPKLDDEFAKEMDETVETLADLKAKIKERLVAEKEVEEKRFYENTLVEQAVANATVEIPEVMIKNELDYMMKDFGRRMEMQGMSLDMYFQFSGQDEAALKEQMKPEAERSVRTSLVLSAIATAENIEVSQEEIDAELNTVAEQVGLSVEDLVKNFGGNMSVISNDLKTRKTVEVIVGSKVIKK